jgi:hypothetical protein
MYVFVQVVAVQGDQIGRIFAYWVIVYFRQFYENYRNGSNLLDTFVHGKSYIHKCILKYTYLLTKNVLGYILGDFFTNSSGHPDGVPKLCYHVSARNRPYVSGRAKDFIT